MNFNSALYALCAICFGSTHLVYAKQTADFVPAWIPPNALFWVYFTGAALLVRKYTT